MNKPNSLREEIEHAINCHSAENGSNTPDYILANFLMTVLEAFDAAVNAREKLAGREPAPTQRPNCPECGR